jgi:hypothetical protein
MICFAFAKHSAGGSNGGSKGALFPAAMLKFEIHGGTVSSSGAFKGFPLDDRDSIILLDNPLRANGPSAREVRVWVI